MYIYTEDLQWSKGRRWTEAHRAGSVRRYVLSSKNLKYGVKGANSPKNASLQWFFPQQKFIRILIDWNVKIIASNNKKHRANAESFPRAANVFGQYWDRQQRIIFTWRRAWHCMHESACFALSLHSLCHCHCFHRCNDKDSKRSALWPIFDHYPSHGSLHWPACFTTPSQNGWSAFIVAAEAGRVEVVGMLADKVDNLNAADKVMLPNALYTSTFRQFCHLGLASLA